MKLKTIKVVMENIDKIREILDQTTNEIKATMHGTNKLLDKLEGLECDLGLLNDALGHSSIEVDSLPFWKEKQ